MYLTDADVVATARYRTRLELAVEKATADLRDAEDLIREGNRKKGQAQSFLTEQGPGAYGALTIGLRPSDREVMDQDAVKRDYARYRLGPVPYKRCAPSIYVESTL